MIENKSGKQKRINKTSFRISSSIHMTLIFLLSIILMSTDTLPLYVFNDNSKPQDWQIVDDVVMGGKSQGQFYINDQGNGVFHGNVSLENNGGFSSLRHRLKPLQIDSYSKIDLYIKGDGKRYQFRLKSDTYDRHSYITYFETNGSWQTVTIELPEMYPTFRGMKLNMPNYPGEQIEELTFLISNKKEEGFQLEISKIVLKK